MKRKKANFVLAMLIFQMCAVALLPCVTAAPDIDSLAFTHDYTYDVVGDSLPYSFFGYEAWVPRLFNPYTQSFDVFRLRLLVDGAVHSASFSKVTYAPHYSATNFSLTSDFKLNITAVTYDKNGWLLQLETFNEGATNEDVALAVIVEGSWRSWMGERTFMYNASYDAISDHWTDSTYESAWKANVNSIAHTFNLSLSNIEGQLATGTIANVSQATGTGEDLWYSALQYNFTVNADSSYVFKLGLACKSGEETLDTVAKAKTVADSDLETIIATSKSYWQTLLDTVPQTSSASDISWYWSWKEILNALYDTTSETDFYGLAAAKGRYRNFAWDNPGNSIALQWFDSALTENILQDIFAHQGSNGGIEHDWHPWIPQDYLFVTVSQPPVIIQNIWQTYMHSKNLTLLSTLYPRLERYLNWWLVNRDSDSDQVYEYKYIPESVTEGQDAGAWYPEYPVEAVDLNALLFYEMKLMSQIANECSNSTGKTYWLQKANALQQKIYTHFWSEAEGFYYNTFVNDTLYIPSMSAYSWTATMIFVAETNMNRVNSMVQKLKTAGLWQSNQMLVWQPLYYTALRGLNDLGMTSTENELASLVLERNPFSQDAIWGYATYIMSMLTYRLGIQPCLNNIKIQPLTAGVASPLTITNIKVRNAYWNVTVSGIGEVNSIAVDGTQIYSQIIPSTCYTGNHTVAIGLGAKAEPLITESTSEITSISHSTNKLSFTVNEDSGQTSTTSVYCGTRGKPTVRGGSTWSYNSVTKIATLSATHSSSVTFELSWVPQSVVQPFVSNFFVAIQIISIIPVLLCIGLIVMTLRSGEGPDMKALVGLLILCVMLIICAVIMNVILSAFI